VKEISMKKTALLIIASAFVATGCAAVGASEGKPGDGKMDHMMMGNMMGMKNMDANGDGMLSKAEFMQSHEAMFDHMKNKDGMVDMKNMQMHCTHMMGGGKMMHGQTGRSK
jgi:hypothetical protein